MSSSTPATDYGCLELPLFAYTKKGDRYGNEPTAPITQGERHERDEEPESPRGGRPARRRDGSRLSGRRDERPRRGEAGPASEVRLRRGDRRRRAGGPECRPGPGPVLPQGAGVRRGEAAEPHLPGRSRVLLARRNQPRRAAQDRAEAARTLRRGVARRTGRRGREGGDRVQGHAGKG